MCSKESSNYEQATAFLLLLSLSNRNLFFFSVPFTLTQPSGKWQKEKEKGRYQGCYTWTATARDRKPFSASLLMISWTFPPISSFSRHIFRICFLRRHMNVGNYKLISRTRESELYTAFKSTCSGAPLLARYQFPSESVYVIAVRLSTGLKGRKCTSLMFARAYSHKCTFSCLCISIEQSKIINPKSSVSKLKYFLGLPPLDQRAY